MTRKLINLVVLVLSLLSFAGCDIVIRDPNGCVYDDECGDGHYCAENGSCYIVAYKFGGPNWCYDDNECGPDYTCNEQDNYCYPVGQEEYHPYGSSYGYYSDGVCYSDSECWQGQVCYNGGCYDPHDLNMCWTDKDCPANNYCATDYHCYYK